MKLSHVFAILAVLAIAFVMYNRGDVAMRAAVPKNMPPDARFVRTGYDLTTNDVQGEWVACQPNVQEATDQCRVTDARGDVIFQGQFLPVNSTQAVPQPELRIGALDKDRLWTEGPAEQAQVPVIPLENGEVLVPVFDRTALLARWAQDPSESQKYLRNENCSTQSIAADRC